MTDDLPSRSRPNHGTRAVWIAVGVMMAAVAAPTAWSAARTRAQGSEGLSMAVAIPEHDAGRPSGAPAAIAPVTSSGDDGWSGTAVVPERPAPGFSLTDQAGARWALSDERGRVVALLFGYTRCPDVCPQTLARLQQAVAQLGVAGDDVQVVLVSTDPTHDTPAVLAHYLAGYNARFVGLTGTVEAARAAADLFGAVPDSVRRTTDEHHDSAKRADAESGDDPAHSSRVWLIDGYGQLRVSFGGAFAPTDVAHDIRVLLDERR